MDFHGWIAIATLVVAMVLFISKLIPLEAATLDELEQLSGRGIIMAEVSLLPYSSSRSHIIAI